MNTSLLYLAKEPCEGVYKDLDQFKDYDITVCCCNPGYVDYYKLLGYNVITSDQLFAGVDMRFDVVIGNPPYQKGKNSNFYVEFINKAAESTKQGGTVVLIVPNRFILPHTPACKAILSQYKVKRLVVDVNGYFPGIGTKIGMFIGEVCDTGHTGLIDVELSDGNVIQWDGQSPMIPSRKPTLEGIQQWNELMIDNGVTFYGKPPTHTDDYVYVCRQWKTNKGVVYFDAEVGPSDDPRDGKYIITKNPQALCEYLRTTPVAGKLYELFGDQMNIWPFMWKYLPISS